MRLKPGVRLRGLQPRMWAVILAADPIWLSYGISCGVTITSAVDHLDAHKGSPGKASLHPLGHALDLRVHDLPQGAIEAVKNQLQMALGDAFNVLYESPGTDNAHLHVGSLEV